MCHYMQLETWLNSHFLEVAITCMHKVFHNFSCSVLLPQSQGLWLNNLSKFWRKSLASRGIKASRNWFRSSSGEWSQVHSAALRSERQPAAENRFIFSCMQPNTRPTQLTFLKIGKDWRPSYGQEKPLETVKMLVTKCPRNPRLSAENFLGKS